MSLDMFFLSLCAFHLVGAASHSRAHDARQDCWSDTQRSASGELQPNAQQFPNGMKAVADYVHSRGLKIGVYTCIGTQTCHGGRPGSYGHYEQDANTLAAWGIDFVKTDKCVASRC